METYIDALLYRAKRVTFEFNQHDKYMEQFKTDEYYTKIGNRLDDLLRISYSLVNFFISTPSKYNQNENLSLKGEKQQEFEQREDYSVPAALEYHNEDYTIYNLDDLPAEIESEFDFNYFAFYSFLSYLKPAFYFIHEYEIVPKGRSETRKERVTRVLANLVQLLSFVRSFKGDKISDVKFIINGLFVRFEKLFAVAYDESINGAGSYFFFQEYPNAAASFSIHALIYEDYETLEQVKQSVELLFESYHSIPKCDDYVTALKPHRFLVESVLNTSESPKDFTKKLNEIYNLSDFKEDLFKLSITLANKILLGTLEVSGFDLNRSFLAINYEDELNKREGEIKSIKLAAEETFEQDKDQLRKSFLAELEVKEEEIDVLKREVQLKDDKINQLDEQLEQEVKKESTSIQSFSSLDQFKKEYPKIHEMISVQSFKLAIQKCYGKINELEHELAKFQSSERQLKEDEIKLRSELEDMKQRLEEQSDELEETPHSPYWDYQDGPPQPQMNGPLMRRNGGGKPQPTLDDRRRASYYTPNSVMKPRYGGGYRPAPKFRNDY